MTLGKAREVFAETFSHWGIEIGAAALERGRGQIRQDGWSIRFIRGVEDGREYIEYYATHRMTSDSHVRIWENGETEELDAIWPQYSYRAEIPGDRERAHTEYLEHNRRVAAELAELGLYPAGDINAYLRTGRYDEPEAGH